LWEFVGDVVEANRKEVRKHDFGDRLQAGHRGAMAAPRIACSEIGVSRTRNGPNCSYSPTVALNTPPAFATSSPRNTTSDRAPFLGDAADDGVPVAQFRHAQPPSAVDIGGENIQRRRGAALQASVASRLPCARWRRSIFSIVASLTPNCF